MLARDLMKQDLEFCTLEDTAAKAAEIMKRRNCGFVPVVRDAQSGILEGVFTDRDLALFLGCTNRLAEEVRVKEFCTRDLRTVLPGDSLDKVKTLMEKEHVHRVPVTEKNGKLTGVITLKDLAEIAWRERSEKIPDVTDKELGEIIESIALSR